MSNNLVTRYPHVGRAEWQLRPRESRTAWRSSSLPALDVAMMAVAAVLAEYGAAHAGVPPTPPAALVALPGVALVLLAVRGLYRSRLSLGLLDELRSIAVTSGVAAMIVLSVRALFTSDPAIAQQSARQWAFTAAYLAAGRAAVYWSERRARRHGELLQPTLIVGAGNVGRLLARRLLERPELGLRPVGFLDKDPLGGDELGLPVLGASWDLERVVAEQGIEHVVVSFSTAPTDVLLGLLEQAERLGVATSFVPRLYERTTSDLTVVHIGGLPLVFARRVDPNGWQFALKYAFDRVVAAVLILLAAPVLAAAALAVWLDLGRPILFRQERVGRDGRRFEILKFRSMRDGAGASSAVAGELVAAGVAPGGVEGVDRRTRVGAYLRRTSIDELPQLFNVLRGDMSLVGPRPERPEFASRFSADVRRYADRHRVKSGITGWAQVHGLRGKTSIADRAEWDNYYIENFSLWLDAKILLMTCAALVPAFKSVE